MHHSLWTQNYVGHMRGLTWIEGQQPFECCVTNARWENQGFQPLFHSTHTLKKQKQSFDEKEKHPNVKITATTDIIKKVTEINWLQWKSVLEFNRDNIN